MTSGKVSVFSSAFTVGSTTSATGMSSHIIVADRGFDDRDLCRLPACRPSVLRSAPRPLPRMWLSIWFDSRRAAPAVLPIGFRGRRNARHRTAAARDKGCRRRRWPAPRKPPAPSRRRPHSPAPDRPLVQETHPASGIRPLPRQRRREYQAHCRERSATPQRRISDLLLCLQHDQLVRRATRRPRLRPCGPPAGARRRRDRAGQRIGMSRSWDQSAGSRSHPSRSATPCRSRRQ